MASPSVFTIEEQSGPGRRLELVGAGLPFRGAGWPSQMRLVTSWNQGNGAEATQHVLGHADRETTFGGSWNTTRLTSSPCRFFASSASAGEPVVDAFSLYRIVDDFARAGRLLRVSWSAGPGMGTEERTIVRLGRIASFEPEFDRGDDVRWRLGFEWIGRGDESRPAPGPAGGESLRASLAELSRALGDVASGIEAAKIRSSRASIPQSADAFTLGDLEQIAAAPSALVDDFARAARRLEAEADAAGALLERLRTTPDALREQVFSIGRGARGAADRFRQAAGALPAETLTSDDRRAAPVLRGVLYVNSAAEGARRAGEAADEAARAAALQNSAIGSRGDGTRIGPESADRTYEAKAGDTFVSLAIRFYGDASRAAGLAKANGLPGYQVAPPPGFALVVPAVPRSSEI